jgi:hypothetical protein
MGRAGEDRAVRANAGQHDGKADGGEHEDDRGVGGQLGEEVGCAAWAEGCLRTLAAKGSGEIGRLTLLQEDYADDEEGDDNVQDNEKIEHRGKLKPLGAKDETREMVSGECGNRCERDLNPCLRR